MGVGTIGGMRYGAAALTVPLSLAWGAASVLSHNKPKQSNNLIDFLLQNEHLIAASIFGTVTSSAFLNMYPLRTLFFGLASIASLIGYLSNNVPNKGEKDSSSQSNIAWLEATIIGCMGLAAISKGNVLGMPHQEGLANHNLEFPKVNNFKDIAKGWTNNLGAEMNILGWNIKNSPLLLRDLFVGVGSGVKNIISPSPELRNFGALNRFRGAIETNAPNCYRGAFQITGLMRLSAFGLLLTSLLTDKDKDSPISELANKANKTRSISKPISKRAKSFPSASNTNETNSPQNTIQPEEHKQHILSQIASWIISFSLIPAAISALSRNSKWGNIPNLLFNASSLLAIPGLGLKLFPIGDFGQVAGALSTKLLIAIQMFAYALSGLMRK